MLVLYFEKISIDDLCTMRLFLVGVQRCRDLGKVAGLIENDGRTEIVGLRLITYLVYLV